MADNVQTAESDSEVTRDLLKQMDDDATNKTHWKILLTAGMGFFTDAYDLFVIGVVASILVTEWNITGTEKSLLSSVALLTSAIGAVVFGKIADRLGRKKIYGWEVIVLAAGAIASAFSPNIWWLLVFRAILGVGIGGDYPVSATIMSEYASKANRGRMVSLVFAMQGAGLVIGPAIAIGLLATGMSPDLVWRLLLGFGAIPGLAVFFLRRKIAETPRFLLAQQEAKEKEQKAEKSGEATGLRGVFADRRLLKWLIGASVAWFLFDFVYYGNTISSPLIVAKVAPHASLIAQLTLTLIIFAVAALPAYFLAAATIDHLGRKLIQVFGFCAIAVAFFLLWAIPAATTNVALFLILFGATYFFSEFGPNTTTFVYPAEIFPVRVRTTSHGIAAAAGKIGAFIGTYVLTSLLSASGLGYVFLLVAIVAIVGAAITLLLLPEPKGKSLEELTETSKLPTSAVVLGLAHGRAMRPPTQ
jgi:MFS transporter, PHS family, inorganic phosphate transporter